MSDLISRQAAIEAAVDAIPYDEYWTEQIKKAINKLPSAQPDIIRCRDCAKRKYCRTSTVWAIPPKDDWFCADAERRST